MLGEHMKCRINLFTLGLLFSLISQQTAWALPADREKPIHAKSDSANAEKDGVRILTGNVVITQGTIKISGHKVTIYTDKQGNINKVIALGSPAHYEEKPEPNKELIRAYGKQINYMIPQEKVEIIVNAKLFQEGNKFTGKRIDYNMKTQTVNAKGDSSKAGGKQRVEMILQPTKTK